MLINEHFLFPYFLNLQSIRHFNFFPFTFFCFCFLLFFNVNFYSRIGHMLDAILVLYVVSRNLKTTFVPWSWIQARLNSHAVWVELHSLISKVKKVVR